MTPYHQRILDYADVCDALARVQMLRTVLRQLAGNKAFKSAMKTHGRGVGYMVQTAQQLERELWLRRDELQAELTQALDAD